MIIVIIALANNEKAIPISIIVLLCIIRSMREASVIDRNTVNSPAESPNMGNVRKPNIFIPSMIAILAPSAAPEDTPRVSEDASGFRSRDCMITPLTANALPAANASMLRGIRIFSRIAADTSSVILPVRSPRVSASGILTLPIPIDIGIATAHNTMISISFKALFMGGQLPDIMRAPFL